MNVGSREIGRMFVGTTEIAEAYLGGTKVFARSAPVPKTVTPMGTYYVSDGHSLGTTDVTLASASVNAGDTVVLSVQLSNCANEWWAQNATFRATLNGQTMTVSVPGINNTWSTTPVSNSFVATSSGTVVVKWLTSDNSGVQISGNGSNGYVFVG